MTDDPHDEDHRRQRTPYEAPPNAPVRRRASLAMLALVILFIAALAALVVSTWPEGPVSVNRKSSETATPPPQDSR